MQRATAATSSGLERSVQVIAARSEHQLRVAHRSHLRLPN